MQCMYTVTVGFESGRQMTEIFFTKDSAMEYCSDVAFVYQAERLHVEIIVEGGGQSASETFIKEARR